MTPRHPPLWWTAETTSLQSLTYKKHIILSLPYSQRGFDDDDND